MPLPLPFVSVYGQASTYIGADGHSRVNNFANWRSRGVNVLIQDERSEDRAAWIAAAKAAGMKYFLRPAFAPGGSFDLLTGWLAGAVLLDDAGDPDCLGWSFPDEFDRGPGKVEDAVRVAQVIRAVSSKPIHWNFTGQSAGLGGAFKPGPMQDRLERLLDCCDLPGFDFHLYATGRTPFSINTDVEDGFGVLWLRLMDLLNTLAPGKPQVVCVESGWQRVDPRQTAPITPAQYEEMISTVAGYAKEKGYPLGGVMIFPQQFGGGFKFDSTAPETAITMKAVHAKYLSPKATPATDRPPTIEERVAALEKAMKAIGAATQV